MTIVYNSCCIVPVFAELKFCVGRHPYLYYNDFSGRSRKKEISLEDANSLKEILENPKLSEELAKISAQTSGNRYVEAEGVTITAANQKAFVPIEAIVLPPMIEKLLVITDNLFRKYFGVSYHTPIIPNGKNL